MKCPQHFVKSMLPRFFIVLNANYVDTESTDLLSVVISLISELQDICGGIVEVFMVSQRPGSGTHSCYSVTDYAMQLFATVCFCACGCVFSKHGGCFCLAPDGHNPSKARQSNTCNLLLNVRRVKYARPPCLAAIPKPNLIIAVCVSTVFINHFHHFFLNRIKWKCNQTHRLKSN